MHIYIKSSGFARANSFQDRLPFLDTGIVDILARATGGVGVVLEHRYYGKIVATLSCIILTGCM
jgi:hypothetical protein